MRCKSLDTEVRAELRSLNRAFLRLLIWPSYSRGSQALGLAPELRGSLSSLAADELEFVAGTPALLAGFELSAGDAEGSRVAEFGVRPRGVRPATTEMDSSSDRVATAACDALRSVDPWSQAAHLFTATLLTWLWKTDRRDQLVLALCIGPEQSLPRLGVFEIETLAPHARQRLRIRFADSPRFWPDLIRAARSQDESLRELSRLSVLPLMLTEARTD